MSATAFQRIRREAEAKNQAKAKGPDINELKVAEIRTLLDEKGIIYDPKARKEDLIKLLGGAE